MTLVFIHGFLDEADFWTDVAKRLASDKINSRLFVGLPGMGSRSAGTTDHGLAALTDAVVEMVAAQSGPMVLIGHSMGAQVAELAAKALPGKVAGLVLLTPVPLGGLPVPEDMASAMRQLGGNEGAQRQMRSQLLVNPSAAILDRMVEAGLKVRPPVVAELFDAWSRGAPEGADASAFRGPVLIAAGAGDGFSTRELIETAIMPRFPQAELIFIEKAGHWPHLEQPAALASEIDRFLLNLTVEEPKEATMAPQTTGQSGTQWTDAFEQKSEQAFAETFAEDVVLEAAALIKPIVGRDKVKISMGTAAKLYTRLVFTSQETAGSRTYYQWEAAIPGDIALKGVTVLTKNDAGLIATIGIYHSPLNAALAFSEEMGRLTKDTLGPGYFYRS